MGVLARSTASVSSGGSPTLLSIPHPTRINALDNGDFSINQRGYVSGTTATPPVMNGNAYFFDRWYFNGSSGTLTFAASGRGAGNILTIARGNGVPTQMIPGYRVTSTIAFVSYIGTYPPSGVLVNNGPPTYSGTVTIGGDTRNWGLYNVGITAFANLPVYLNGGSGTISEIMMEFVPATTYPIGPFERIRAETQLHECQQYFNRLIAGATYNVPFAYGMVTATNNASFDLQYPPMRTATPTVTLSQGTLRGTTYTSAGATVAAAATPTFTTPSAGVIGVNYPSTFATTLIGMGCAFSSGTSGTNMNLDLSCDF